jgi:hypothetical protein
VWEFIPEFNIVDQIKYYKTEFKQKKDKKGVFENLF